MSFVADKKRRHEAAAEKALGEKDYAQAFFHTAKAAECGLALAEQSEGKIARRHAEDALELIDLAEQMKAKARTRKEDVRQTLKAAAKDDQDEAAGESTYQLQTRPDVRLAGVRGHVRRPGHEQRARRRKEVPGGVAFFNDSLQELQLAQYIFFCG